MTYAGDERAVPHSGVMYASYEPHQPRRGDVLCRTTYIFAQQVSVDRENG